MKCIGTVSVKWGTQSFDLDAISEAGAFDVLKAQLFDLTNVPVERQKLLCKGKQLKARKTKMCVLLLILIQSDDDVFKLPDGSKLMLMGTADALPQMPVAKVVFAEDLSPEQKSITGVSISRYLLKKNL